MRFLLLAILLASTISAFAQSNPAEKTDNPPAVDVELVLAADVSFSMGKDKLAIRREGYAQAIVSKEFLEALKTGPNGKLAITYVEWAASDYQKVIVPWRVIDGPEAAAAVAAEIMKGPAVLQSRTSISAAISFAMSLFDQNPYRGSRRVIDISGDGPNNSGEHVEAARDAALAKGITINGLPMMLGEPSRTDVDIDNLEIYYEDCVTGGPGSFVMTVKDREKLKEAIRTMLVSEVAGVAPERPNVPPTEKEKRISCSIGEEMHQRVWGKPSGTLPLAVPSTTLQVSAWQHAEFAAHIKKCFHRQKEPIRNQVDVSVTIGPDGMIIGNPEIKDPIDNDAFRRDANTALKKVRQCQPFIVDPFRGNRTQLTQVFRFGQKAPDEDINATIRAHFKRCWTASRTGPTIHLWIDYKPDGTLSKPPTLFNPENTAEYSRTAAQVIRQLTNCPPLKFPKDKYDRVKSLKWRFPSHESAKASRSNRT
jgi:Protein of unknown function (DUF1194)